MNIITMLFVLFSVLIRHFVQSNFWMMKLIKPRMDVKMIITATEPEIIFSLDFIGLSL